MKSGLADPPPPCHLTSYMDGPLPKLSFQCLILRAQWKSERNHKLMAAREAALTDERQMIESRIRVEDLPSWVFFPDKVC